MQLSRNARKLLEARYLKDGEAPEEMFRRVAKAVASCEKESKVFEELFYDAMINLRFLPNSPTLMNAGRPLGMLSACFVLPVGDSIEEIFDAIKNTALVQRAGGGTGFNFSDLRPRGALVASSGGTTTGPCEFLKVFSQATTAIQQGAFRRGANMGIMEVSHPDILEFINIKNDLSALSNFNLSVGISDYFMRMLRKHPKKPMRVYHPKTGKGTLGAKWTYQKVWDMICESAWRTGEPGVLFMDTIDRANPTPSLGKLRGVNPCAEQVLLPYESCLHGGTLVLAEDGVRRIDGVDSQRMVVAADNKLHKFERVVCRGVKPIQRILLSNNLEILATEDHKFDVIGSGMTRVADIGEGDKLRVLSEFPLAIPGDLDPTYEMLGWLRGDGWFSTTVGISFNYKDGDVDAKNRLLPVFRRFFDAEDIKPMYDDEHKFQIQVCSKKAINKMLSLGFKPGRAHKAELPSQFYTWCLSNQIAFIRGLFGADGGVSGRSNKQIHFASNSLDLAKQVQEFLSCLGIHSSVYTTIFKTGRRKPQHRLAITKKSARMFMKVIGFSTEVKNTKFNYDTGKDYQDEDCYEVLSIDSAGMDTVYDIVDVNGVNTFYANGVATHNCNLASMCLPKFVSYGKIMLDELESAVRLAIRFLDDVITVNKYPIPEIRDMCLKTRKVGLGIMGFADMLTRLGIPYNSSEAVAAAEMIMEHINTVAHDESALLGKEKGYCPAKDIKGCRNASVTTIAPTGSLSIIANCSGGVEPPFSLVYNRHVIDSILPECSPLFKQALRNVGLLSEDILIQAARLGSIQELGLPDDIKALFQTARDVPPEQHLRIQAAFQKHTDAAVSKTINLPASATVADVQKIYEMAYSLKAKGVTVYRDGCRAGQPMALPKCSDGSCSL